MGNLLFVAFLFFSIVAYAQPVITTQPVNASGCQTGEATLTIAATGAGVTYRWQKYNSATTSFENLTNSAAYSGVTTTTLTIDFANGATAGDFQCRVTDLSGIPAISNSVTVSTIAPPPSPTVSNIVGDDCEPKTYALTASSPTAGEFRWYSVLNATFPESTETVGSFTTPLITSSITYNVAFFDGTCESLRAPATVTLNYAGPGSLDVAAFQVVPYDPNIGSSYMDDFEIQSDGKIVVNELRTLTDEFMLARMNADGTVDATFNNWGINDFNGRVDMLSLQGDKIIAGGRFTNINGTSADYIARFNANGTIDGSFNATNPDFDNYVTALAVQSDDKIVASGVFTKYNNVSSLRIIRLNADGSIDGSFNVGTGLNADASAILIRPDGKILIAGQFTSYNATPRSRIALLNSDGTLDPSFDPPTISSRINAIALQSDGKVVIGGFFTTVGGLSRNYIARLNADGSHDTSFDPGTGFDDWIYSLYVDPSGKILAGGWPTTYNGVERNFIVRLMPDGSLDEFFNVGVGPYTLVTQIKSAGTDRIFVGGYIDSWNRNLFNGMGVVNNDCIRVPEAIDNSACPGSITIGACGGSNGKYRWYTQPSGGTEIAGETNSTLSISALSSTTTYYVTLKDEVCESVRVPVVATITGSVSPPTVTSSTGCTGATQVVSASGGTAGQYRWYTVSSGGTALSGETNATYTTPSLSASTTYFVSINNGTCESLRSPVTATVTSPLTPTATDVSRCGNGTVTLTASGGSNGQYRWYAVSSGGSAIPGEVDATFITPALSFTTTYYVSLDNGACEGLRVAVTASVNAVPLPPEASNVSTCSGSSAVITATGGSNGNFRWYTVSTGGTAISGEVNSTYTTPSLAIATTYYVALNVGGCESNRIPVQVTINNCSNEAPQIQATSLSTAIYGSVNLNLLDLISDTDGNLDVSSLQIIDPPQSGASASIDGAGNLTIDYTSSDFAGTDYITIQICDIVGACTSQQFEIEVVGDIVVYNALSPNGDGLNEVFFIQYIDLIPDTRRNTVTIYNRWGDVVFNVSNYNNNDRVFAGLNNNGNELPSGTYFYKIEFSDKEAKTGYLSLKR